MLGLFHLGYLAFLLRFLRGIVDKLPVLLIFFLVIFLAGIFPASVLAAQLSRIVNKFAAFGRPRHRLWPAKCQSGMRSRRFNAAKIF